MNDDWKGEVDSMVSSQYVNPLYPKKEDRVTLRIKLPSIIQKAPVFLMAYISGEFLRIPCTFQKPHYAFAEIIMPEREDLFWYFALVPEKKAYYYGRLGLQGSVPSLIDCFRLVADLQPATWVSHATCYQIFPDRFKHGDPSCGAKEGQYTFDGGTVTTHSFAETPLDFEHGRCLDFFNGDLKGIEDSLDHFKKLGVNTLYLNPIGVSRTTHRYDCCDFFHVDEKLGGDEAFVRLCKKLHEHGMKIIIDISINHTGIEHPWLKKAKEDGKSEEASYYYTDSDGSIACWQDVPTLPQLNYTSKGLRNLMYQGKESAMRIFLRKPYLQDGWRLDVANEVGRRGKDQLCHEIWQEVRSAVKQENPEAYLVGEDWSDASSYLQGDQWDGTMNYLGCSRPLRSWMGETDRFLCNGWGHDPEPTTPYTGFELAQALHSQLASIPPQMWYQQFNLLDSHDTPRLHNNTDLFEWEIYRGCVLLMYLLPGMPNIYYGDEIGLAGPYGSVEASRYPMQWNRATWDERFLSLYTWLGSLRKEYASLLSFGSWKIVYTDEETFCFARYNGKQALLGILNRAVHPKVLDIPNQILMITKIVGQTPASLSENTIRIDLAPRQNCLLEGTCQ